MAHDLLQNNLQVVPPTARKAVDANDIGRAVATRLSQDAQLKQVEAHTMSPVFNRKGGPR